jgi:hypothetical protein
MHATIRAVKEIAPNARLDCCPYDKGEEGTGFFVRLGMAGHWLGKVSKTPRGAWASAYSRTAKKLPGDASNPSVAGKQ